MKDQISALMDGEVDEKSAARLMDSLARDEEALRAWRAYHVIGDAMRGGRLLSDGFTARVAQRLAEEPTVLAPRALRPAARPWFALSAAASVAAAVGLVGWMAFAPQQVPAPAPVAQVKPEAKPDIVPLPTAANDYLLAHQGFSPRISLAPYVRTVADHRESRR